MYLLKSPSGNYHFRLRLPKPCQAHYQDRKEIKQSLRTTKKRIAQPLANQLYDRHMVTIRSILLGLPLTPPKSSMTGLEDLQALSQSLDDLVQHYLDDIAGNVTSRTNTETRGALQAFLSLSNSINHKSANGFSDILKRLPPGFRKDDMKSLSKEKHKKLLSAKTHNKYVGILSAFNNWLVRRGEIDKNYFTGLKMKRLTQAHTERDPYTPDEVKLLLDSTQGLSGFKYWLPRLALYTGCRLNELSQLYKEDVVEIAGLLCLKIQNGSEGQHLKNLSSQRIIPVHPELVDEFREYLSTVKGARVFPNLTWTAASNWGGLSSKWFARHRKVAGISKPFHSLRHTFASKLLSNRVDESVIGDLLGHSKAGETGRYTGSRPVEQLMDSIRTLDY